MQCPFRHDEKESGIILLIVFALALAIVKKGEIVAHIYCRWFVDGFRVSNGANLEHWGRLASNRV